MNFDLIGSMWVHLNELDGDWIIGVALEAHFVQVFAFGRLVGKGVLSPLETDFVQAVRQFSDTWQLTTNFAVTNAACKILQKSHHG